METTSSIQSGWVIAAGRIQSAIGTSKMFTRYGGVLLENTGVGLLSPVDNSVTMGGAFPGHTSGYTLNGEIARYFVYKNALSDSDIITKINQLATEYGI